MQHQETDRDKSQSTVHEIRVIGPTGKPMTRRDLPAPGTTRWVVRRKAEVVAGVRGGLISLKEACHRYNLSTDEFESWQQLFENHGLSGLRATSIKKFRRTPLTSARNPKPLPYDPG